MAPPIDLGDKSLPTPDPGAAQIVRTYGPGRFLISDCEWREPILVTPTVTVPVRIARAEDLTLEMLAFLKTLPVPTELVVLGCGARAVFVPPDKRAVLKAAGFGLEVVDTGSACRIYNVLLAESRRVAAALIPV